MSEPQQSFQNHRRFYAIWHFFAFPVLAIAVIVSVVGIFRDPSLGSVWRFLVSLAIALAVFASRTMALRVQDRLIRLEERLRLVDLLPDDLKTRVGDLTPSQLIGLRFATDDEVGALAQRVFDGELTGREEIKREIKSWRADWFRA